MRLNSWTGTDGPPASSLNCDRPLHSGLKAPELAMDAASRDNRWTTSLYTGPPGCSPLVPPPSQEVGSAWASLSLVGCKHTSSLKACSRETHCLSRTSKIYRHKAFQITHLHTTVINSGHATLLTSQHRTHCGEHCGASLSAACGYHPGWCCSHPHRLLNDL